MNNDELKELLLTTRTNHQKGEEHAFDPVFKYCYIYYKSRCKNLAFKAAFVDAMFKVWEKFILKQDSIPKQPANYISRMIENTWKNHHKRGGKNKPISLEDEIIDYLDNKDQNNNEDDPLIKKENEEAEKNKRRKRFWALAITFFKLSECCQEIMTKIHYEGKKLKDLEGICGLKNYTTRKTKKSQCQKRWEKFAKNLLNK